MRDRAFSLLFPLKNGSSRGNADVVTCLYVSLREEIISQT